MGTAPKVELVVEGFERLFKPSVKSGVPNVADQAVWLFWLTPDKFKLRQ